MQSLSKPSTPALVGNTDTSLLKLIALLTMLVDHLGAAFFPSIPSLRVIGRIALPLYCWCVVVGCTYTSNIVRYGLRLLFLALISQPLYIIALNHTWAEWNILTLLCVGVFVIAAIQKKQYGSQFWGPLLGYLFLSFVTVDYGWKGLTFILLLYLARQSYGGLIATYLAYALFWGSSSALVNNFFGIPFTFLYWEGVGTIFTNIFRLQGMIWIALPLVAIPMHTGIKIPKWLGYAFYPLHLVLLIYLSTIL